MKESFVFTDASIGNAVATRGIMADLRSSVGSKGDGPAAGAGHMGGPAPFSKADRSRFLQALHDVIERLKRSGGVGCLYRPWLRS